MISQAPALQHNGSGFFSRADMQAVPRKIIHVDMDAFFAAVEQRDHEEYRGKPVIVGGRPEQRGVVATASYEARKYGVHSAMASAKALRLCPHAVFLPPRFGVYKRISRHVMGIMQRYTPLVEVMGLDEAYMDVTDCVRGVRYARDIARSVLAAIVRETGLTASAGVAPNKFLAKIASDMRKPAGLTVVPPQRVQQFLEDLAVRKLPGVGRVTEETMRRAGILTVGDLRNRDCEELERLFGKSGQWYYALARGEDDREVVTEHERKSIGCEQTFPEDLIAMRDIRNGLQEVAAELAVRIVHKGGGGRTVTLKITFADFRKITRSTTFSHPVESEDELFSVACCLLEKTEAGRKPLRLLGITVSQLDLLAQLELPFNGV